MKLLLDEALQDRLVERLAAGGHDVVAVRRLGMQGASDDEVLARTAAEGRILVTTDTDFGTILALTGGEEPSVILLRGVGDSLEERHAAIVRVWPLASGELAEGVIAVVEPDRIRLRRLPIEG